MPRGVVAAVSHRMQSHYTAMQGLSYFCMSSGTQFALPRLHRLLNACFSPTVAPLQNSPGPRGPGLTSMHGIIRRNRATAHAALLACSTPTTISAQPCPLGGLPLSPPLPPQEKAIKQSNKILLYVQLSFPTHASRYYGCRHGCHPHTACIQLSLIHI